MILFCWFRKLWNNPQVVIALITDSCVKPFALNLTYSLSQKWQFYDILGISRVNEGVQNNCGAGNLFFIGCLMWQPICFWLVDKHPMMPPPLKKAVEELNKPEYPSCTFAGWVRFFWNKCFCSHALLFASTAEVSKYTPR